MGYVIKSFNKFFIRDSGDHLDEIYDLNHATAFETKKDAVKVCNSCIYSDNFKVVSFESEKKLFDKWAKNGMLRRKLDKVDKRVSRPYNGESLEGVLEFLKIMRKPSNSMKISYEDRATWPEIYTVSKFITSTGTYYQNDDREKEYFSVSISVNRDSVFEEFKEEIELLLKFVDFYKEGYLFLSIIDNELSEFEIRYFLLSPDLKTAKIVNHYDRELFKGSLEECFNEMRKEYYYN